MSETIRTFIVTMSWNSRLPIGKVAWGASLLKFSGTIFQVQLPTPVCFFAVPRRWSIHWKPC